MDNALTPALAAPTTPANLRERLAQLPVRSLLSLGAGAVLLIAIAVALASLTAKGDYKVLFAGLSDKDGGAVTAQLTLLNVPYRIAEGGGAIMVPASQVHELRLKLAAQGLPKGSAGSAAAGFELLDNARFGQTQFQERTNYQRALEGELARSIGALQAVSSARVHLSLPQQNGFFREQQKPSASVLVNLHNGRSLERAQIAGIVHLVASSVPELQHKAVSVIDHQGGLLTATDDKGKSGLDDQQLQYLQQVEQTYLKRVVEILEPVLGRDNLRANVTAEVDFSQTEATAEEYKPNQGEAPSTVRSRQTSEANLPAANGPAGVPGAASNQPPTQATAPVTGNAQTLQAGGTQGLGQNPQARREAITNYEVDKTVKVTRNATGSIKRLHAAVLVNHRTSTDPKGKVNTTPLSNEEIEKLTALVQQSLGFNKDRGDSVRVVNFAFKPETAPKMDELPLWKQAWVQDLLRAAGAPLALALLAFIAFAKLVKPALNDLVPPPPPAPPPGTQLDAVVDDPVETELQAQAALPPPEANDKLEMARRMAKENPAAVAEILRGWSNGEPAKV